MFVLRYSLTVAIVSQKISDKHSFTLYPSLDPYRQTDRESNTLSAWAGGTFFPVVLYVVSVFGSGGK